MKIYIVVRPTEDSEFNQIKSFWSVHLTEKSAEEAITNYGAGQFEILEREIN